MASIILQRYLKNHLIGFSGLWAMSGERWVGGIVEGTLLKDKILLEISFMGKVSDRRRDSMGSDRRGLGCTTRRLLRKCPLRAFSMDGAHCLYELFRGGRPVQSALWMGKRENPRRGEGPTGSADVISGQAPEGSRKARTGVHALYQVKEGREGAMEVYELGSVPLGESV